MANITRWDPLQEMLTLREAMNQLFEESYVSPAQARQRQGFVPALDLSETPESFIVEMAVPGMKPENLDIAVENGVLTVKGEVKQETTDKNRQYHRIERHYGAFTRTLNLPTTVKVDAIQANLRDGVLHLDIPKAEEVKPRKINVAITNADSHQVLDTPGSENISNN